MWPNLVTAAVDRPVGGWAQKKILARHLHVVAEEVAGASCLHAARRTPKHPYLARQLSDGEIWTAHRGVNPCGLFVQRGDRELRTRWLC
jgi:hypothetical protein